MPKPERVAFQSVCSEQACLNRTQQTLPRGNIHLGWLRAPRVLRSKEALLGTETVPVSETVKLVWGKGPASASEAASAQASNAAETMTMEHARA